MSVCESGHFRRADRGGDVKWGSVVAGGVSSVAVVTTRRASGSVKDREAISMARHKFMAGEACLLRNYRRVPIRTNEFDEEIKFANWVVLEGILGSIVPEQKSRGGKLSCQRGEHLVLENNCE